MKRDIKDIKRNLEDKKNNDIILKKSIVEQMFNEDPDLNEILDKKDKRPLNQYFDKDNPTEQELEERKLITEYNNRVNKKQIIPFLKLNGINKEVLNFIMFDIADNEVDSYNKVIKYQILTVMCLVHEDDMETEYGIFRPSAEKGIFQEENCHLSAAGISSGETADAG